MTYLRYLVVAGFKSLRDWNLLELAPGVTVLVGGNGTGKSSLSEALLWGLGENDHEQLRVTHPHDLVFRASTQRSAVEQELLFRRPTVVAEPAGQSKATVYLVLGEEGDPRSDEASEGEVCCCKPRTDDRAEVPTGGLRVGRSIGLSDEDSWELEGEPASGDRVATALGSFGLDRRSVAVIRQGELERLLVADEALRADIIAQTLGFASATEVLGRPTPSNSRTSGEESDRRSELAGELALAAVERWGDGDGDFAELDFSRLGLPQHTRSGRSVEELLALLDHHDAQAGSRWTSDPSGTTDSAFARAVVSIDRRFRRIFARLSGGEAAVRLTDHEAGFGVAVEATFPGHPPVHLDALSGGQRALVAFALGLSVFEEGDARLLVFDEVEPALDESNLRVFNDLLHEAARGRQVVVISHQRRTKDVGDVVFGFDHVGGGAAGLHFRYEPHTRKLVVFGRVRGNWLDRTAQLAEESPGAWPASSGARAL